MSTATVGPLSSSPQPFRTRMFDVKGKTSSRLLVSTLPRGESVPESQKQERVQHDPVVLWRMKRPGMRSHTVISPRSDGALVVWFVNGRPLGYRDFHDWTSAIRWSDQLRKQNWSVGWRD